MRKVCYLVLIIIGIHSNIYPQIGGNSIYQFLNLTNSARIAALGGDFTPLKDKDISFALSNPSIINKDLDNDIALSFINYYSGINMGYVTYSKTFDKIGSFAGNVQYVNYGDFKRTDETGNILGEFKANEYAVCLGWGRQLDSLLSIGANLKSILSYFDDYRSYGLAVDVAGTYSNPKNHITATLIAKNIGTQLKTYTQGSSEPLPFQLQAGITKGFAHVPLRFSLLYNHIEKFNLIYVDPNNSPDKTDPITGEVILQSNLGKSLDKLMRHIVVGAEFIPAKFLSIQLGYNYQRRKELGIDSKMSLVGFSGGVGIKISKFSLNYSRVTYHLTRSPNYLTLSMNISELFKK